MSIPAKPFPTDRYFHVDLSSTDRGRRWGRTDSSGRRARECRRVDESRDENWHPCRGSIQDFREFYRADNARAMMLRGNGVRLSIVKRIVESYGGKIRVESEKNGLFFSAQLLDQGSLINRYS